MKRFDIATMPMWKRVVLLTVVIAVVIAVGAAVAWVCSPFIEMLSDPVKQLEFEAWVQSLGVAGVAVMLAIQVAQIVIAFIPGEVVQVIAGMMYGTWGGLALCLSGCVVASAVVFAVIRKFGRPFVVKLFGEEQLAKFSFLNDSEKLETLMFILFLIPGLPKDTLTYIVPLTPIKLSTYLVLSTIGRIPGMVASTLIGSSLANANWPLIIGIFVVVIVVGFVSIWKRDDIMHWAKSRGGVRED